MKKFFVAFLVIGLIFSLSHIADAQTNPVTLDCFAAPPTSPDPSCETATRTFSVVGDYRISVHSGGVDTDMIKGDNVRGWFWGMHVSGFGGSDLILGNYDPILGRYIGGYSDANAALAAAKDLSNPRRFVDFSVAQGQTVNLTFYVDDPDRDNEGSLTANIAVVPEPISSVLFVVGGSTLAARRFMRRKKIDRQ